MKTFNYLLIVLFVLANNTNAQVGQCQYYYDRLGTSFEHYACRLTANVPIGRYLTIEGDHIDNKTDVDVVALFAAVGSTIPVVDGTILNKFTNLTRLELRNSNVTRVTIDAFSSCDSLEVLYLSYNQLTTIEPFTWINCKSLQIINLNSNQISSLNPNILAGTDNLKWFDFELNPNPVITGNIFTNKTRLHRLSLSSNNLTTLSRDLLRNQVELTSLELYSNRLTDFFLIRDLLSDLSGLTQLYIGNNGIASMDLSVFKDMNSLETLSLNGNFIGTLSADAFSPNLWTLSIMNAGITEIDENAFRSMEKLRHLQLDMNPLRELPEMLFHPLGILSSLSISFAGLTRIHGNAFKNNTNMERLQLEGNNLVEIEEGTFTPLINLRSFLNLEINQIKRLNANSFGQHHQLYFISISMNRLDEIEPTFFRNFPNLTVFNARDNICVDGTFTIGINTDDFENHENLQGCFKHWVTPRETTTKPSGGSKICGFIIEIIIGLILLKIYDRMSFY